MFRDIKLIVFTNQKYRNCHYFQQMAFIFHISNSSVKQTMIYVSYTVYSPQSSPAK